MKLEDFARCILFGNRLEDKLLEVDLHSIDFISGHSIEIPRFPGRPEKLARPGKATFPSLHHLHEPTERGKVLHFFANHELLAMELMALLLLRFPEAPVNFRLGVARIIQEEQSHLRLYLQRMRELGVDLGDLPVSDYFWNAMKGMQSPLDFTVQMSLTFEQANLDFSLFFMRAVAQVGDEVTAQLLERVFREEIGHVKHGLAWFNRWRESPDVETDWDAYVRLLPRPLTPLRAKGFQFCADARRQAGFSESYIRELGVYSGSKGRPPMVWFYNPHCDGEIARGRIGFSPTEGARKVAHDLEAIPIFLAAETDVVILRDRPRLEWLEELRESGWILPEIVEAKDSNWKDHLKAPKIGGMQPWGWSPDSFQAFLPLRSRLIEMEGGNSEFCRNLLSHRDFSEVGIGEVFSKAWSVSFLRGWLEKQDSVPHFWGGWEAIGECVMDWATLYGQAEKILASGRKAMLKAPYGSSGMQVRKVNRLEELAGPIMGWAKKALRLHGVFIVEPYLDRMLDLSLQMEITSSRIRLFQTRQFIVGDQHEYRGAYLGRRIPGLQSGQASFFHQILPHWKRFLRDLGMAVRQKGYQGPLGVDACLWKDRGGNLKFKPLIELNPRWTMGRVALDLEKYLAPKTNAGWFFIPLRIVREKGYGDFEEFASYLKKKYPIQFSGTKRIESGVVFTNDPKRAQSVLTVLATLPNPDLAPHSSS